VGLLAELLSERGQDYGSGGPAAAELRQHAGYSWIYDQILASPDWFAGFLRRHGLQVPRQPPVPRRYFGEQ
jgi:hypothetical protein